MAKERPWLLQRFVMANGNILAGTQAGRRRSFGRTRASSGFVRKMEVSIEGCEYDKRNSILHF